MPSQSRLAPAAVRWASVVVGSLNFDHVITVDQPAPPGRDGQRPRLHAVPGGKGLNQAVTAARQGAEVVMVGCMGDDMTGGRLLQVLSDEGIEAHRRAPQGRPERDGPDHRGGWWGEHDRRRRWRQPRPRPADVDQAGEYFRPGAVALAQLEIPVAVVPGRLLPAPGPTGATTLLNPAPAPAHLPRAALAGRRQYCRTRPKPLALSGRSSPEEAAAGSSTRAVVRWS